MAKQTIANLSDIEKKPLREFSEKAYLNYSMYVILDRALPHIGDGLKPVQRRIIYSMSELGLNPQAKHKKSARTVGDVLGKYHPHGDSACYEAMVLMAQDFSYRYPIIDGQGNWGSPDDPKSFAAMRYTESKLSPYAEVLLKEIDQGTVDWGNNFDGTLREPTLLPARLPNVLLNGSTGIAVGMATDIPPHNLREVANACLHLLRHPKTSLQELCEYIQGPDFPSSAEIITPKEEIMAIYQSGNGTIRLRARYIEENDTIVIVALPYQASPAKVLEQIAAQMQAKKLPLIADLRDESDHENPTRLVIIPRSQRVDVEELMSHLFATTDLEKTIRINLNMIGLDGRPTVKSLLHILQEWLEFRVQTVRRRLQYRLDKVLARLHVLDGLLIAYLNIDEVIAIIRKEDEPKPKLMKRFKLSEQQAEAILELKLRHLARLEEVKIRSEQQDLSKEKDSLQQVLDSPKKLKDLIFNEIKADAEKYGDARKSPLVARQESQALKVTEVLPVEPVTVVLSNKGWVRAAKGHDIDPRSLSYRAGDEFKMAVKGRSNQWAVFLDSTGRAYSLPAHSLPSARSHGEPLTSRVNPPEGASFAGVMIGEEDQLCLLAANNGYGFIAKLADLQSKNRNGKAALNLAKSATPLTPCFINDLKNDYIAAVSNTGHLLLFSVNSLPMLAKGKGNKIMHIPTQSFIKGEEYIVDVAVIGKTEALSLRSGQRSLTLKPQDLTNFLGERGQRGKKLPRGFQKVEKLIPQNDLGIIL